MDLYGDLPEAKSGPSGSASSSGGYRKTSSALFAAPQALKRRASTATTARKQQQRQRRRANSSTGALATGPGPTLSDPSPGSGAASLSAVRDEYDPFEPLDYEVHRAREVAERKRSASELLSALRTASQGLRERPPADHLGVSSGEEAFLRRARLPDPRVRGRAAAPLVPAGPTKAERMMLRMGWRRGEGLGKSKQGMTTPLECRKTSRTGGMIVSCGEAERDPPRRRP